MQAWQRTNQPKTKIVGLSPSQTSETSVTKLLTAKLPNYFSFTRIAGTQTSASFGKLPSKSVATARELEQTQEQGKTFFYFESEVLKKSKKRDNGAKYLLETIPSFASKTLYSQILLKI